MSLPAEGTLLILDGMGIPLYSCRGASQTITPISQSNVMERSCNGILMDLSSSQFQKYSTTISCKDQQAPAVDASWAGKQLTVSCLCELSYPVGGTPQRPQVVGSSRTVSGYVFYRPILVCRIGIWSMDWAEWARDVNWTLPLEEV